MDELKERLQDFYEVQLGFINTNNKKIRRGITTGTVATAVSKAGAMFICDGKKRDYVNIKTTGGKSLDVIIEKYEENDDSILVYARKYAGDDIDATNLALIYARVKKRDDSEINITGGEGVGIVTRAGLDINVGQSAINPKPRESIIREIQNFTTFGFDITICVKDGEVIAKKTFNERLGIVKGISIIGTTGIVEPMSIEALKSSIEKEIKVKSKEGDKIVLSFGNMGEKALNKLGISSDKICICSNYVGDALEYISNCDNVTDVLIAGNFAKAVKLAGGIFNTHSHVADAKNEIIAANLALLNAPYELIKSVMEANTSRQITQYISSNNFERVYDVLARRAEEKCDIFIKHGFKNHILMFDYDDEMLNSVDISIFI
ncbi:cobalt-precorrin 5B C1-methyltransferase [[Eubacterium] yurii]|jgi:cobalamin biosynthesis protein cbiD|nr:cobalt-precorrin 5B C1-methyltransferase [[Eubacterium] yurii]